MAKALMLQGTGSDVGKTLIVAGLCRAYMRRGLRVRPFKPQNMSNNAAVTLDGGEIGRAQALQAQACGVPPSVHMNPVLLKPQSGTGSQIILQGRLSGQAEARTYQAMKKHWLAIVLESFQHLKDEADLVLVEGAGSASEINLRANDIANMGFARAADVPVIVIGDIDRGGVIAQIAGTKLVITPQDAEMVVGFLVNRFRGDPDLFKEGMRQIEHFSGWRGLGLIPHCPAARDLPAEDAMALGRHLNGERSAHTKFKIVVPVLPGIANFDDLDPLRMERGVELIMIRPGTYLPVEADLVLLIGSKTTIADLVAFREAGWDVDLAAYVRRGGKVFGLCGGYQMLGENLRDPLGLEGPPSEVRGLGLLALETVFTQEKTLVAVEGVSLPDEVPFTGFEMHVGHTSGDDCARPFLRLTDGRQDGAVSKDGRIAGCYVHGLFGMDTQRRAFLARFGVAAGDFSYLEKVEAALDAVADHLAQHIDLDHLLTLAR
ncbi:cobyric acid synthase [Beijerinckia indica]|uniref:Cobyric acid synthase n=1 Tax=Beijerinckia indica subsp. indica (strain ATCC 9039 / DSM 1715 / NCIMB 8712) TaxID=395963 RepID=COBQ_BEII9|nr:cobyric acid synthase [Beijerinckia indica]B2IE16.1 RecName: Full=Cobyric acid synthase [Beijerinckia indica subsp. indica ATCC 9039]ACB94040.1 cobyric acid synthase CobQ [Beijerinckia indica subsp. indica ATCC 9039]